MIQASIKSAEKRLAMAYEEFEKARIKRDNLIDKDSIEYKIYSQDMIMFNELMDSHQSLLKVLYAISGTSNGFV